MPDLTIHDVPEEELEAVTARAIRHGRSPEDEVRYLIHDAASEEHLVQQLEQARRAEEALRTAEQPAPSPAALPRRRYRSTAPTPRLR